MHSVANIIVKTKIQYTPTNRNETFSEFTQGKSQVLTQPAEMKLSFQAQDLRLHRSH